MVGVTDSRIPQVAALIDDARTVLADMSDEGVVSDQLLAARCSLNVALKYVQMLAQQLGEAS